MTLKELKEELKKYNDDSILKIKVKKFSESQVQIVDETTEDLDKITFEHFLDNSDYDYVNLEVTLYEE